MKKIGSPISSQILLIFLLTGIGCKIYTSVSVSKDADTDFTKYHTFAWLIDNADTNNLPYNNEIIRNNIRNYFAKSFSERGYTINLENPDLLLQLVITNQKREKIVLYSSYPYPMPYYYNRYYYGSNYYFPYNWDYYYRSNIAAPFNYTPQSIQYVEGTITLNVNDHSNKKLVWAGTAIGDIYDPRKINKNIHPAVESIMKKYPVKPIIEKR